MGVNAQTPLPITLYPSITLYRLPGTWYLGLVLGLCLKKLVLGGRSQAARPSRARGLTPPRPLKIPPKIVSFLHPFFDAFLDRFLVDFASQLGSQNPLKSVKNRCQDAFHLGHHFWIDFWSIFAPNFDPQILIFPAPAAGRARIIKNRSSKLTSIFDPILVPTWLRFGTKFHQNPSKNRAQETSKK